MNQPKKKRLIGISFISHINATTAPALLGAIHNAVKKHDQIHLLLSTPGGSVSEGVAIYNSIKALPIEVYIYNIGTINSIGNVVFQAGTQRIAAPASSFMFHGVGFDIQNERFELKQLNEKRETLKNDQSLIAQIIGKHTKLDEAAVERMFLNMEYVSSEEALKRGITDEVRDINLSSQMPVQQLIFQ